MIYRIDVSASGADPAGSAVRQQIAEMGLSVGAVSSSRIFLIDSEMDTVSAHRVADELLADPLVESGRVLTAAPDDGARKRIEVHLKPGVMDPVAASTEMAIKDMGLPVRQVRTGRAFLIDGKFDVPTLERIARGVLANGVIESVHLTAFLPTRFENGHDQPLQIRHVELRDLSDDQLTTLSRKGHLFLSLAEMKAIQAYFRSQQREPTDIELETLAQTWSEHCVHKTLKSSVVVEDEDGRTLRRYDNLIKETIFSATKQLMEEKKGSEPFCLSVFADNAGVVAFDETNAVCFKVETHNHPSAIEPYGGSATGAGGVIRDILGTGLAAKPVANTDVFCVANPDYGRESIYKLTETQLTDLLRKELRASAGDHVVVRIDRETAATSATRNGVEVDQSLVGRLAAQFVKALMVRVNQPLPNGIIHPKRVLRQIVSGVRDYGNRMGIPTVNGAVYFDDRYLGNPLVFCGCVGLIPRGKIAKAAKAGDAIIVIGGRTGRDGVHGATFSSAELTDTHADEFSHAVQIGNAITEKKMADVILAARDRGLFNAITDCGAGGLSSAVGEMGQETGALVELDKVPLKYAGLRHDEIWISEAQERMAVAVPQEHVAEILKLAASEDVEATVIGTFGTERRELILNYRHAEVGRLSMQFLHDGLPKSERKAIVTRRAAPAKAGATGNAKEHLLKVLASPNVASKHWIIRQYDHEVQGGSVIKPLIGPLNIGPSDAAVIRPSLKSYRGIALGCGMVPAVADPYDMAIASIDEAVRNVVAVGAKLETMAILDNFCWPSVDDARTMGTLVAACEACRDAALSFGIPFISGKDSLHNQFTNQETGEVLRIPNTLLISAMAVLDDVRKCITMDFKGIGNCVCLVSAKRPADLKNLAATHRAMAALIATGTVHACHDVSDGGVAVAAAEMCIASGIGLKADVDLSFAERPGEYLVEVGSGAGAGDLRQAFGEIAEVTEIGQTQQDSILSSPATGEIGLQELTRAWRGTLDW